eukprot:g31653.t1
MPHQQAMKKWSQDWHSGRKKACPVCEFAMPLPAETCPSCGIVFKGVPDKVELVEDWAELKKFFCDC